MSQLTIEEVRHSICLSMEATQEAQNSIKDINLRWISYYKHLSICQQLIDERQSENEIFFAVVAAQRICKTNFSVISEASSLSLFQSLFNCMNSVELNPSIITQIFSLSAILYCIHPSESIKEAITTLTPDQIIEFYTILGEQMNDLAFVPFEVRSSFSEDILAVLTSSSPSPQWVGLLSSFCIKIADLTTLIPLIEIIRSACLIPESVPSLFNVISKVFSLPYDNLMEEETPFVTEFITIILTSICSFMQSGSFNTDFVPKIFLCIVEIFEYSAQFASLIESVEFTQNILSGSLDIMSALSDFHSELILAVISLSEFFHSTLEPQVCMAEGHISCLDSYPYQEQLNVFVSIVFDLIAVDDSESESEDQIHGIDLAKSIYSITSIPKEYLAIFESHLQELTPCSLYFTAYSDGQLKKLAGQYLIGLLVEHGEPVEYAMPFIEKCYIFFRNDQKVAALEYAWNYFLQEQTPENAFVIQHCARVAPAFFVQNTSIQDSIIANCSNIASVSCSLIPTLYITILYPTICMQDKTKREGYIAAANQIIANKFEQLSSSGNIGNVLMFIYKLCDHISNDFSISSLLDSYEVVYMKLGNLSMAAYQNFLFPFIREFLESLLTSISEYLVSDNEEVLDFICDLMSKCLSIQLLSPEFVFSWITAAFSSLQSGSIYSLFIANVLSRQGHCLMNFLTPEDIAPFIDALPALDADAFQCAVVFICFLAKMHDNTNICEKAREVWSNESFFAMFPLERITEILQLPVEMNIGNFLDFIQIVFPVGSEPQAPPEWGQQISQFILGLTKDFYCEEALNSGIFTLAHLCAGGYIEADQIKSEILSCEQDEEDVAAFVQLFDTAVEEKVNPMANSLSIKDALCNIGRVIILRARSQPQ